MALITGSDRGLGFALTQELTARGWRGIATCRSPEKAVELTAIAAIDALAAKLLGQPIDALINNAGVLGRMGTPRPEDLDPAEFQRVMRVNTYAPMRLARTFMPNIAASGHKKIVSLSSALGSLTRVPDFAQNAPGYDYAISKVGLIRSASAAEGKPITTPMVTAAESARGVVDFIIGLNAEKSGRFFSHTGAEIRW